MACCNKIHAVELDKHCRICAKKLPKGRKHSCSSSGSLLKPFGVNVATDEHDIHPQYYCHNCHSIAKRLEKPGAESELTAHKWSQHMPCPCCNGSHAITTTSFVEASEVVLKAISGLQVHCDKPSCPAIVALKHLDDHIQSCCQETATTLSPSKLTLGEVLSRPLQSVPTLVEQKAAANVVHRLLHTSPCEQSSPSPIVKLRTEGTVSITYIVLHTCTCNLHE